MQISTPTSVLSMYSFGGEPGPDSVRGNKASHRQAADHSHPLTARNAHLTSLLQAPRTLLSNMNKALSCPCLRKPPHHLSKQLYILPQLKTLPIKREPLVRRPLHLTEQIRHLSRMERPQGGCSDRPRRPSHMRPLNPIIALQHANPQGTITPNAVITKPTLNIRHVAALFSVHQSQLLG
jgi:hypothetical protein